MAKTILVPGPIILRDQVSGEPGQHITLREWAFLSWFNDPRWHKDLARLVLVVGEFAKKPGQTIELEDADYAVLAEVVRNPQAPQQPPLTAMQMEPFKMLVLRAGEEKTDAKKK